MSRQVVLVLVLVLFCFASVNCNLFGSSSSSPSGPSWSRSGDVTLRPSSVSIPKEELRQWQQRPGQGQEEMESPELCDFGWWTGLKYKLFGIEPEGLRQQQKSYLPTSTWSSQGLGSKVVDKLSDIGSAAMHLPEQAYHSVADSVSNIAQKPIDRFSSQYQQGQQGSLTEKAKTVLPSFLGGHSTEATQYEQFMKLHHQMERLRDKIRRHVHEAIENAINQIDLHEDKSTFESIMDKMKGLVSRSHEDQPQHGIQQMIPERFQQYYPH